jgi:S-(hydroxymethyl)mycothiol dehydrogenase
VPAIAPREGFGALLNAPGEAVSIESLALDGPGPDEVQVRIEASGVCHTDLHVKETDGWGYAYPILLGHEGAGVVEDVGDGVDWLALGQRVVLAWRAPCGSCRDCERGAPRLCRSPLRARRRIRRASDGERVSQTLLTGTFAERTIVHGRAAIPVPAALPPERACLIGCAVATGIGAVLNTSPAWPGSSVVVIGCGGVGLAAVQGARIAGAARIVAVDVHEAKLSSARAFGATDTVDASAQSPVDSVRELTGGEGVDFAYDAVGRPETLAQAVAMLGHAGTATLIGIPPRGEAVTLPLEDGRSGLFPTRATVRVSHGGDQLPAEDFPFLARLALEGKLDLAGLVTRVIALEDVESAFADLARGEGIRSVIRF